MNEYWQGRGFPWEYDPGPPKNRRWPRLFAETPNYRGLGRAVVGKEAFRWHFGPMFYRGRLRDNAVRVVVIGQEGAQDESLAHRSFTGGTGARMQYLLNYIGITESYLFLNTFVYPIFGQYTPSLRWLAQDQASPIVQHRHEIFNYVLKAAKESVVTWVESRGGTCPQGAEDVSLCTGAALDPHTKIIGVRHPGGAGKGGSVAAIIADFKAALAKIRQWMDADPDWLTPDPSGRRMFDQPYKYRSAPIPFRDFPYGFPLRLGRGGTSSNRRDRQRAIQIFSAGGAYDNKGDKLHYSYTAEGSADGYAEEAGDVPYEPPKKAYRDYDKGPGTRFARLFMGGMPGLEWPDFDALGATGHPSFGCGPIYRGRPDQATVLILADQQAHDDLFTGRALTGESGQRMQAFLRAMGIVERYVIIRVFPVDTLSLPAGTVQDILDHPQTLKVYQAIVDSIVAANDDLKLLLTFGPHAHALRQNLVGINLPGFALKAWREPGALHDWQGKMPSIQSVDYAREIANPSFAYDGRCGQIPRFDLPYGTVRWVGSSGDRASQAIDLSIQRPSPHYFKLYMPRWAARLKPLPLSPEEQAAVEAASG